MQDGSGAFWLLVPSSPSFLKDVFRAYFFAGIAGPMAVVLIR